MQSAGVEARGSDRPGPRGLRHQASACSVPAVRFRVFGGAMVHSQAPRRAHPVLYVWSRHSASQTRTELRGRVTCQRSRSTQRSSDLPKVTQRDGAETQSPAAAQTNESWGGDRITPSPAAEETEARGHAAGKPREASASWLCWTPLQPPLGTPSKCPRPLWGTGFLACLCPSFLKLAALCSPPAHVHRSVLGASVLVHMKSGWEKGA